MNIIRQEKKAEWYDSGYQHGININALLTKSPELLKAYYPMWQKALEFIPKKNRVADFGCGCGHFVKMLILGGFNFVYGCDFSKVAIGLAIKRVAVKQKKKLFVKDLYEETFTDYDTVTMFEVLEHIERDLDILKKIPKGKQVIFSVPSFNYRSHVRFFKDVDEIKDRYGKYVEFLHCEEFNKKVIYLCVTTKK
jgi:2-polyprenyl-3-methyl-5-hydroxy-6-metoxy-1,4-benzoquinol methylase